MIVSKLVAASADAIGAEPTMAKSLAPIYRRHMAPNRKPMPTASASVV
jgi:hypothetical protein